MTKTKQLILEYLSENRKKKENKTQKANSLGFNNLEYPK